MKAKSLKKKLILKKETIAHLGEKEMGRLKAGGTGYACGTRTCVDTKCFC